MIIKKIKTLLIRLILNDPEYTLPEEKDEAADSSENKDNENTSNDNSGKADKNEPENQEPRIKQYKLARNLAIINVIIFSLYICYGYLVHRNKELSLEYYAYFSEIALTERSTESIYPININTATQEELTLLPDIGTKKAKLIIEYRTENNGFNDIEELLNISGIGESTFNSIKDLVILE